MKKHSATRIITTVFTLILAISGFNHGLFEVLQGNKNTSGLIIQAIGPENRMWFYGTEEAFSIIPNFLISGILAIGVSIVMIIWVIAFIERQYGRKVLLLLFILLFLFGGGIAAQVAFSPWILSYSTRIGKPLTGWKKVLSPKIRSGLSKVWLYTLPLATVFFVIGLEMAIFGYFPGLSEPDVLLQTCWTFLLAFVVFLNITYISGFSYDILKKAKN